MDRQFHVAGFSAPASRADCVLPNAYHYFQHSSRVLLAPVTPRTPFDVIVNIPQGSAAATLPEMGAMVSVYPDTVRSAV